MARLTPEQRTKVVNLLHVLDGHLGLAVYRGDGIDHDWREAGKSLILKTRQAIKLLEAEDAESERLREDFRLFAAVVNRTALDVCRPDGGLAKLAQEQLDKLEAR